uniref:Succinate--CoA ligase [ADP-forming] subunit beta, mitochondrial n=1 Tax=Panagrolaimus sp. PS1159 TaxID=55785 RepID=A0AC35GUB3_9BILA
MFNRFNVIKNVSQRLSQIRFLNLHEYQSRTLLKNKGCNVESFIVLENPGEIEQKLNSFDRKEYVVKAQILAGGRGQGHFIDGPTNFGGVFISKKKEDVINAVKEMLGKRLVTKQTDPSGVLVKQVLVSGSVQIKNEKYLAFLMDRDSNGPVIVASPFGGMNIEELAEKHPELILKVPINILTGVTETEAKKVAKFLEFPEKLLSTVSSEIKRLYELFIESDATQIEINPLSETHDGEVFIVDSKFNFDDNAAFRQKEIFAMENHDEQDPHEVEAKKHHLNYIRLDGNIACLVNGAGLAMATMDIIKHYGGKPANFLDVGGSVTEEQVFHAFQIVSSDPNVKGILVNIFGGIVNCATIATGIINACKRIGLQVPMVVRLEGTNVSAAKEAFNQSGLSFISVSNLDEAAEEIVTATMNEKAAIQIGRASCRERV